MPQGLILLGRKIKRNKQQIFLISRLNILGETENTVKEMKCAALKPPFFLE